jgi:hypothetical protein
MTTYPVTIPQCQYIKTNGIRCGSPALRHQKLCYYHDRARPVIHDRSGAAQYPAAPFFMPLLEDINSIQRALSAICDHLLHRRLDPQKAGVLLYAIQLASSNLAKKTRKQVRQNQFQIMEDAISDLMRNMDPQQPDIQG